MKLTTKGRYAVTAMLDIALNTQNGPVNLAQTAERQAISVSYLEQLLSKLKKAKLVKAVRGPGGGYLLGLDASEIKISHIVDAVNERVDATRCAGQKGCQGGVPCLTHDLWQDLSDQIHNFLSSISIGDLMAKESVRKVSARQQALLPQKVLLSQAMLEDSFLQAIHSTPNDSH